MKVINPLAIDGVLLLNKSEGMTSNTALQKAKKLLGAPKAGHTGSLDPLATGMLPLCFGEATKVCQFLLDADKCYQTTGLLGVKTNTADATGEVIARVDVFNIPEENLLQVLMQHTGHIKQTPSMFSALKHNGVPLYRMARKGINIERAAREILIHNLLLNAFDGIQFSLTVTCSKGTYIRNLVEDIGDALGVGAHVTQLHRVYTAGLENMPMYSLDELEHMSIPERIACIIPMDRAVDHLDPMTLSDDEIIAIRQGRIVANRADVEITDCVRLYDKKAQFIGLGERNTQGGIKAKRLLSF
ncbi:tRNA pseudouridine synthase B [Legionella parisiensis]|uniref:tRNA pseudouridine synthase B n=1 Tax=Legionella parisiensis TaxID=45071 RepID=A0A1E5JMC2_9GAMM|nr:tRNA pseudouridine(55) synthase TruB [Legionella parisiensis]KTD42571.1 tRNA pseudouridine synthase B [Legionella parisiensis]OEH45706.1 tRNA pseudouridine synthase B [Legionella parisiensis]STX71751.1 tRNA pseudouridine synthase B [Legionella parisiensis]